MPIPQERACAGPLSVVHQHFKLVMPFTVAENLLLANRTSDYRSRIKDICAAIKKQSAELASRSTPIAAAPRLSPSSNHSIVASPQMRR